MLAQVRDPDITFKTGDEIDAVFKEALVPTVVGITMSETTTEPSDCFKVLAQLL